MVGCGEYGKVFKAIQNSTGKTVAIKYIDLSHNCDEVTRTICREFRIMLTLSRMENNNFTVSLLDAYLPK
jgi:serine/threonine protein kinase